MIEESRNGYKKTKLGWIPNDWELKKLGNVGSFHRGKGISKKELTETGIPCVTYGEIYTKHDHIIKKFYSFINPKIAKSSTVINKNDILFAGSGETLDEIGKSVAYLGNEEAYAGGDIIILRTNNVNSKYLTYLLNNSLVIRQKRKFGQGHSVVHIYSKDLGKLLIPIPPPFEQQKIARILSTWDNAIERTEKLIEVKTKLKKGLMQQLLTGKKRFPGYNEIWKYEKLRNLANIKTGDKDNQDKTNKGGYPFFVRSEIVEQIDTYSYDGEAILIPGEGKIGDIIHYINGKFDYHQRVYKISDFKDKIDGKFCYYYLKHHFKREALRNSVKATVDSLRLPTFQQMKIMLPSINEQIKIVKILNVIDNEINNLQNYYQFQQQQKKGLMQKLLTGTIRVNTQM